jgi:hypothetical protein
MEENCRSLHGTLGQVGFARDDKGEISFPVGISCRDPRSQKRDLGHPSIFSEGAHLNLNKSDRLGFARLIRPTYALANVGHPSYN